MTVDSTISVGDLLTSLSILVAVGTLAASWWRDRQLRRGEIADRIRAAAGRTIARLERWEEIIQALFVESQPVFVEVSEQLAKDFDAASARDRLWRELNRVRLTLLQEIRREEIETSYVEICTYHPHLRETFSQVVSKIKSTENAIFDGFLKETELDVLHYSGTDAQSYDSAWLGNRLRATAKTWSLQCREDVAAASSSLRGLLIALVAQSNGELLRGRGSSEASMGPPGA
jgi:hypothetical protein